jgi:hypothetical protein
MKTKNEDVGGNAANNAQFTHFAHMEANGTCSVDDIWDCMVTTLWLTDRESIMDDIVKRNPTTHKTFTGLFAGKEFSPPELKARSVLIMTQTQQKFEEFYNKKWKEALAFYAVCTYGRTLYMSAKGMQSVC